MSTANLQYQVSRAGKNFHDQPCTGLVTGLLPRAQSSGHPVERDLRLLMDDGDYRFRIREDFRLLPRLAGGTILFNLNGTYADAEVEKALLANREFELQGTNMTNALVARAAGGGLVLTTAGASADQSILAPLQEASVKADGGAGATYSSATDAEAWAGELRPVFRAMVKTDPTDILQQVIWAGFKLTSTGVVATDNDQFYFRVSSGASAGTWHVVSSNNNTDEDTDTSITITVATTYLLEVLVDANRVPYFYINGRFVKKGAALKASVTTFKPFIGLQGSEAVAKNLTVRYIDVSQDRYSGATSGTPGFTPALPS